MLPGQGGSDSIPGQGTRSHMPQLKILCAITKTQHSQINKIILKKKKELATARVAEMVVSLLVGREVG